MENQNSGYGASKMASLPLTTGKTFFVVTPGGPNDQPISELFKQDSEGVERVSSSYTLALAKCVAGYGDTIIVAPDFVTAPTATELFSAETKGVTILQAGQNRNGKYFVQRATSVLPQTIQSSLFTVTGRIKLLSIIGEVTTVIQTQADNTKIVSNPTVGADVDLCAVLDISAGAVGTNYTITGTLADAMTKITSGAGVHQASPLIVTPGTIDLNCAASNTGSVKWFIEYESIDPGAFVFVA